jgi:hypothetical protein
MDTQKVYTSVSSDSTEPLSYHIKVHIPTETLPKRRDEESMFASLFAFADGVISISLQSLTYIGSFALTVFFLAILHKECTEFDDECNWD